MSYFPLYPIDIFQAKLLHLRHRIVEQARTLLANFHENPSEHTSHPEEPWYTECRLLSREQDLLNLIDEMLAYPDPSLIPKPLMRALRRYTEL